MKDREELLLKVMHLMSEHFKDSFLITIHHFPFIH